MGFPPNRVRPVIHGDGPHLTNETSREDSRRFFLRLWLHFGPLLFQAFGRDG